MSLLNLSSELILNICAECSLESLKSFGYTCRTSWAATRQPIRYRRIKVTTHKPFNHADSATSNLVHEAYDSSGTPMNLAVLAKMQNYVQELSWVISNSPDHQTETHKFIDHAAQSSYPWDVFNTMSSLRIIRITSDLPWTDKHYLNQIPPFAFGSSQPRDLQVSGAWSPLLMRKILCPAMLAKMENISLDTFQGPGCTNGTMPFRHKEACEWPCQGNPKHHECEKYTPPGDMVGLLPSMVEHCSALTTFYYRKAGCFRPSSGLSVANDQQRYQEIAALLVYNSSHLEHIEFEQSVQARELEASRQGTYEVLGPRCVGWPSLKLKPMDERFVRLLWPALFETQWPKLKSLKLIGVGNWGKRQSITPIMKAKLRKHLGSDVEIVYQLVSEKTY